MRSLVLSIHGIRTRGPWQKGELQACLNKAGFDHVSLDYGYMRITQFLFKWSRERQLKWFLDTYTQHARDLPNPPSIIAHSFGTWLVARALQKYGDVKFDRIILCGSIVDVNYPWDYHIDTGRCAAVLNEYGQMDVPARLARWVVEDMGLSGVEGFNKETSAKVLQRAHPEFKHSDYFFTLNYEKSWIPFLQGNPPEEFDNRFAPSHNWRPKVVRATAIALLLLFFWWLWSVIPWSEDLSARPRSWPDLRQVQVPTKERVLQPHDVDPSSIEFVFRNDTDQRLQFVLYNCLLHYEKDTANKRDPWSYMVVEPGRESGNREVNQKSGVFLVWARDGWSDYCFLGLADMLAHPKQIVTVRADDNSGQYQWNPEVRGD